MASSTHESFWPFLALLMSLHIGKADAWWFQQSSGYPSLKSAPTGLSCGPSGIVFSYLDPKIFD